ncbi:protein phosphatase 1L [Diaphorina citri]|uniref:Protein phosphatase 1L n=1 Tax=Diaphorina citri TaxID=121845 RepID=A0A3Q0J0B5_DIACI|nr:protein phosphatase 1L [Diaphorina citri]KAI5743907.1 hypothetical protein M8J77_023550 [Diaphorina citri]
MEDELEDKIFYQTFVAHMKILSKFTLGVPINTGQINYLWRIIRYYILKPEFIVLGILLVFLFIYLEAVDIWSRSMLGKIQLSIFRQSSSADKWQQVLPLDDITRFSWESQKGNVAAYALQGRRSKMEDRFVINENIDDTGVSLIAVFDGHGGEFAANFARDNLMTSLNDKVIELKKIIAQGLHKLYPMYTPNKPPPSPRPSQKSPKPSLRKNATTDECSGTKNSSSSQITDPELLSRINSLSRPITREVHNTSNTSSVVETVEISSYIEVNGKINYIKLVTDEVLLVDQRIVENAKKTYDVAGTTALIAILEGTRLIVANVGDSRGVMCDSKGNAIPLSFDHKPQQMRERKRIKEAGGFIAFNGVWRVAGILATSRALGDYPLKDKKLVIADPDILTFDLSDHKPQFLILASDGLWDIFSNEEAVNFIKQRLGEELFGAKSLTLQAYYKGSLDNITVIVINLMNYDWAKAAQEDRKKK